MRRARGAAPALEGSVGDGQASRRFRRPAARATGTYRSGGRRPGVGCRLSADHQRVPLHTGARTVMSAITLNVNGRSHAVDVDPGTPLLFVLSDDLGLRGPKFGCGLGQCGACTVLIQNRAV